MTRTARTLLLLATFGLLLTGVCAGALSVMPATPPAAAQADEPFSAVELPLAPAAPALSAVDAEFIAALVGPATDVVPEQALELVYAAHRVCEAITAEVPVIVMADTLVVDHGLTDTEARDFIALAGQLYCATSPI